MSRITAPPPSGLYYRPLSGRSLRDLSERKRHHDRNRFQSPMAPFENNRFLKALAWHFFYPNEYRNALKAQPVSPVCIDWEPVTAHTGVSVTFIRHATVLIRDKGAALLIDPVFGRMFPFVKDFSPLAFDLSTLPVPDTILITHGHFDHLDMASLRRLNPETPVITPLGYDREFSALKMRRRTQLDWYESVYDGKREITLVPAHHWTLRNPLKGPNRSLWGGYMIRTAGGPVIYVAGDTAYFDGFEQLAADFSIDLAIFNMSAYAPHWFMGSSHMNPEETVRAFTELGAKKMMIVHWGAFRLGDEPVHLPPLDLKKELSRQNLLHQGVDLKPGQTLYF